MALIAHRMMLRSRSRPSLPTHQKLARNKVGVLVVPSLADYCNEANSSHATQMARSHSQSQFDLASSVCTMFDFKC